MPFSAYVYFYMRRLRTHPVQEALGGLGIAVGVALVFAVQVANHSVTAGSERVVRSLVGAAELQLRSSAPNGLEQQLAERAQRLPGVEVADPVLDVIGSARAADGRTALVHLASAESSFAQLAGLEHKLSNLHPVLREPNLPFVLLPRATAQALGVSTSATAGIPKPAPVLTLRAHGRATRVNVVAVLGPEDVGPLSSAMAVIGPLESLQGLTGMQNRVSSVLVRAKPHELERARRGLVNLAAGRLSVVPADEDVRLLRQATIPSDRATGFFAFVSAFVGLLFAFNAMLLSTPERRRVLAELRIQGARPRDLAGLLMFQAVCLGLVASAVGVALGAVLSGSLFHQTPGYLALAFPLGTETVVSWNAVVLSLVGGIAACCLAACPPLLDMRGSRALDAVYFDEGEPGHAIGATLRHRLLLLAVVLGAVSVLAPLVFGPEAVVPSIVALAFAAVAGIPTGFAVVLRLAEAASRLGRGSNMLLIATRTLRATTLRSLALAATGAIAVYGTVAANGAHTDLLHGLYNDYAGYVSTADVWVTNPGDELATSPFAAAGLPSRIARLPGAAAVRQYQGGFSDLLGRRVWVIARSPATSSMFPADQLVSGDARVARERLRAGGWIVVSQELAEAAGVGVGETMLLPTPSGPTRLRIAATTTNLGWSPGAIVLDQRDYRQLWGEPDPSALEVDARPGVSAAELAQSIESRLGSGEALRVQTSSARASEADALARDGLARLSDIARLLTVAAVLAMAAAMGASMWQRRPALASLRIQSFRPTQLQVVLLWESLLVVGTGCLVGGICGLYGHALIDVYLRAVTGFPVPFSPQVPGGVLTAGAIVGAALVVLAVPGFLASRVEPSLALRERG